MHAGVGNAYKIPVLHGGLKFQPISISPQDAQYIETRRFQIAEVSRMYRVPMHMLSELDRATHSNIEQAGLEFLVYTLMPWMVKIEEEINRKLFLPSEGFHAKFNERRLIRSDMAARQQYYSVARQNGWYSANDVLRDEGMNPIGPEGDVYWAPVNQQNAKALLSPLATAPKPPILPGSQPEPQPSSPAKPEAMRAVFADAIARMLRREAAAMEKGNADARFYELHAGHVREAVMPAVHATLAMMGRHLDRSTAATVMNAVDVVVRERHDPGSAIEDEADAVALATIQRLQSMTGVGGCFPHPSKNNLESPL
jgi:hypothetical protein